MATAQDLARALAHGGRLEMFAHLDARIWEVVGGGPQGLRRVADQVALNPQPLPPHEAGKAMFWVLARGIIVVGGRDTAPFLEEVDGWCGTGWPRHWPWPWPGPDPDPRTDEVKSQVLLGAALEAAGLAARFPRGEMQEAFDKASGMLLDAALGG